MHFSNSAPGDSSLPILCYYINDTNQLQLIRIGNASNWLLERIIFPGQRFMFDTLPDALLEIYSHSVSEGLLLTRIPCQRLRVQEKTHVL
jgi:hypothetical protein